MNNKCRVVHQNLLFPQYTDVIRCILNVCLYKSICDELTAPFPNHVTELESPIASHGDTLKYTIYLVENITHSPANKDQQISSIIDI